MVKDSKVLQTKLTPRLFPARSVEVSKRTKAEEPVFEKTLDVMLGPGKGDVKAERIDTEEIASVLLYATALAPEAFNDTEMEPEQVDEPVIKNDALVTEEVEVNAIDEGTKVRAEEVFPLTTTGVKTTLESGEYPIENEKV